ncbi:MAG: hypothetical protein M1817_003804 [Caeruleum heppii]|nr:MAG: hypothetical protein M1817_003804 [Caeruleum heppii]
MAIAVFSTNFGAKVPRPVPIPGPPVLCRSNPEADKAAIIDKLQAKWPVAFREISFPVEVGKYYDEHDVHLLGSAFLYDTLHTIASSNTGFFKTVKDFAEDFEKVKGRRFRMLTPDMEASVLFNTEEKDQHGMEFLGYALVELKALKDRQLARARKLQTEAEALLAEYKEYLTPKRQTSAKAPFIVRSTGLVLPRSNTPSMPNMQVIQQQTRPQASSNNNDGPLPAQQKIETQQEIEIQHNIETEQKSLEPFVPPNAAQEDTTTGSRLPPSHVHHSASSSSSSGSSIILGNTVLPVTLVPSEYFTQGPSTTMTATTRQLPQDPSIVYHGRIISAEHVNRARPPLTGSANFPYEEVRYKGPETSNVFPYERRPMPFPPVKQEDLPFSVPHHHHPPGQVMPHFERPNYYADPRIFHPMNVHHIPPFQDNAPHGPKQPLRDIPNGGPPSRVTAGPHHKGFDNYGQYNTAPAVDERLTTVFVGNLGRGVQENELWEVFSHVGPVLDVKIPKAPPGFKGYQTDCGNRRYAFIRFARPECAYMALTTLNGINLKGVPISVNPVRDRKCQMGPAAVDAGLPHHDEGYPNPRSGQQNQAVPAVGSAGTSSEALAHESKLVAFPAAETYRTLPTPVSTTRIHAKANDKEQPRAPKQMILNETTNIVPNADIHQTRPMSTFSPQDVRSSIQTVNGPSSKPTNENARPSRATGFSQTVETSTQKPKTAPIPAIPRLDRATRAVQHRNRSTKQAPATLQQSEPNNASNLTISEDNGATTSLGSSARPVGDDENSPAMNQQLDDVAAANVSLTAIPSLQVDATSKPTEVVSPEVQKAEPEKRHKIVVRLPSPDQLLTPAPATEPANESAKTPADVKPTSPAAPEIKATSLKAIKGRSAGRLATATTAGHDKATAFSTDRHQKAATKKATRSRGSSSGTSTSLDTSVLDTQTLSTEWPKLPSPTSSAGPIGGQGKPLR